MQGPEIRQSFLDFFAERGHAIVASAPVVPWDDPTLLFTNAGMNQFKPYFLGTATPESRRVADTQKCIRVSGKHNDLEEVGHDTYHHTFFEMLGNWSFGDYYKKEAIAWAWDLLTRVWGLPRERLYATVFEGDERLGLPPDDEAARLWTEVTDIDPSHVLRFGKADNFWMMGDVGPCGPCSEIHMDLTPDGTGGHLVNAGSPMAMEIWNLVFIEFNSEEDGSLRKLPACHVDTGMGLERAAAVIECTEGGRRFDRGISNYDTGLFRPLLRALEEISGRSYTPGLSDDEVSVAMRVCADHARMVGFSIADGAIPSNEGRGYVIRRLLRRAARYGRSKLDLAAPFLWRLVAVLAEHMGEVFPEIRRERSKVEKLIRAEEESFNQTLDRGLVLFEEELERILHDGGRTFPGSVAFKLYDTFGFPLDLTEVMARERGLIVDVAEFDRLMEEQRERGRASRVRVAQVAHDEEMDLPPTYFVGHEALEEQTRVVGTLGKGQEVDVVLAHTPFYAEKGGQVGDTGVIAAGEELRVEDTQEQEGTVLHRVRLDGKRRPEVGEEVRALVDRDRRLQIERHHTGTHLLHHALRDVLGEGVRQQGSLVAPDRLRFDFTHHEQVGRADLAAIEREINGHILANDPVSWFEIPYAARPDSVIAFFGDKYGDRVRVVKIGGQGAGPLPEAAFDGYSMELCGGTHTRSTGEIGVFRFLSEGAIAAGIRRVEAVCGRAALDSIQRDLDLLEEASARLNVPPRDLEKRIEALLETNRRLERELEEATRKAAASAVDGLLASQATVGDVSLIAANLGERDAGYLRQMADALRPKFHGVAVLAGTAGGKVQLLTLVSKDLVSRGYHAGNLVRELARELGGGGGGRPDMAEAGARDASRLGDVLARLPDLLRTQGRN